MFAESLDGECDRFVKRLSLEFTELVPALSRTVLSDKIGSHVVPP